MFLTAQLNRFSLIALACSLLTLPLAGCTEEGGGSCSGCGEDADADGWTAEEGDCNDEDPMVFPTAVEIACDGIDQDCTGEDLVPDDDGDGATACPANPEDCNDDDGAVFPGADELCDEVDHDCDGESLNGLALQSWYPDLDEDGFGDDSADAVESCDEEGPEGLVLDDSDCDDEDPEINPDGTEVCDGVDHDCDGSVDNGLDTSTWYPDVDLDDFGDINDLGVVACDGLQPADSVLDNTDCDDQLILVNPNGTEICNGIDDNCDAATDEGFDEDADGVSTCGPDGDPSTLEDNDCEDVPGVGGAPGGEVNFPGNPEICDARDNNCDGLVDGDDPVFPGADQDLDGDNSSTCPSSPGTDCNDFDPAINGLDVDADGESSCDGDCNDENVNFYTGALEYCEGLDTDCDGLSDDADPDVPNDGDNDGVNGILCGGDDCDDSDSHVFPVVEYTSGPQKECDPAVNPGIQGEWHVGRVELPTLFEDGGNCYLYFRGNGDQNQQAIGVVEDVGCTGTFSEVNDNPNNPILELPALAAWDDQGISNPTVVFVPTMSRPYMLFYHAKDGASRKVGLATATDPMGPFARLDGDGLTLNAPVVDLGALSSDTDSRQVHHPVAYFDGTTIHMWYTGRMSDAPGDFFTVYATSVDGVSWTKFDDVNTALAPEPVVSRGEPGDFDENRVYAPGLLAETFDPEGGYNFEHWYTGRTDANTHSLGIAHGGTTSVTKCAANPVLEGEAVPRMDSFLVSGQGLHYEAQGVAAGPDFGVVSIHYGGVADLDPICCPGANGQVPGTCTTYPWDENYLNLTCKGAYVASAVNNVPVLAVTNLADNATITSPFTLTGTVDDNAPDMTLIEAQLVAPGQGDGLTGAPVLGVLAATGNTSTTIQQTTFSVEIAAAAGTYDALVTVEDEGCSRRTMRISNITVQ